MANRSKSSARWLQEHFTDPFVQREVFDGILALLPERQVGLVLSDMAPSWSGIDAADQPRSMYLAELALDMAAKVLKGHGDALIKVFQGAGFQELIQDAAVSPR